MADIAAIRDGLSSLIDDISGLEVYDTWPGTIVTPCAIVQPSENPIVFDETMGRGLDGFELDAIVLVGRVIDKAGQDKLDGYMAGSGVLSIKAKVDADRTLNGSVSTSRVIGVRDYGTFEWGDVSYFGCRFTIQAWATGA